MIISCTPIRISLAGGGTDLFTYYRKYTGQVISTTIDKYVYVLINRRYDSKICIGYSKQEIVDSIDQIQHDLIRECAKKAGLTNGFECKTIADIPSEGSGLGSSSAICVGLLNAFYQYTGRQVPNEQLAKEACEIEIDILHKSIGRQDQYASAIGGFNRFTFNKDDSVTVEKYDSYKNEEDNLQLFYTGITRKADIILKEQQEIMNDKLMLYHEMAGLCNVILPLKDMIALDWSLKKQLSPSICNTEIDKMIALADFGGASACKILGAGGGGFLLTYCEKSKQDRLRKIMKDYKELPFKFEPHGTRIIFNYKR